MTTRTTHKRLDILDPAPTGPGGDLIQDNFITIDDVLEAIPTGGTTGQILSKASDVNYDTEWADAPNMNGYATTSSLTSGLAGKASINHSHPSVDIYDLSNTLSDYVAEPESEGTAGQVLTTDGSGGRTWSTVSGGGGDGGTTYTAGTGLTISGTTISITPNTYSEVNHTHSYQSLTAKPTSVSSFTNDAGYLTEHQSLSGKADVASTLNGYGITDAYTKTEVDAKVSSVYRFKGNVNNYASLPASGQTTGDVYNLNDTGANYAWNGSAWDKLGETIDLSIYATTASVNSGLSGKANSTHTHTATDITSGTLPIARIPTGTTATTVAVGNHTHQYSAISGTPTLATVATTGSYNDLSDKPTISGTYTLPTATTTTLGGVKVGSNLAISNGVLSATNTTYNSATTTTAGLMSAADKSKLNGIATGANYYTLPTATNSVLGGVKVGSGLSINNGVLSTTGGASGTTTLSGLADVVLTNLANGQALTYNGSAWINSTLSGGSSGSSGSGGSNITPCSEMFTYWDENSGIQYTVSNSTPYPAEVAHKAGYAYCSAWADGAGYASGACRADYADSAGSAMTATTAMAADYISGEVASAQTAKYAIWAGPCYGEYASGNVAYSNSKASVYESNGSDTGSLITICPLPPLGPFMVHVMIAFTGSDGARTLAVYVCGDNLQITAVNYISGDTGGTIGALLVVSGFDISDSTLRIDRSCFHDGCNPYMNASQLLTTATVCGRIGSNNIYYSS